MWGAHYDGKGWHPNDCLTDKAKALGGFYRVMFYDFYIFSLLIISD